MKKKTKNLVHLKMKKIFQLFVRLIYILCSYSLKRMSHQLKQQWSTVMQCCYLLIYLLSAIFFQRNKILISNRINSRSHANHDKKSENFMNCVFENFINATNFNTQWKISKWMISNEKNNNEQISKKKHVIWCIHSTYHYFEI